MHSETKNCQNCQQDFTIESEDFDFYKHIEVPVPTFCPECRMQRRMSFLNDRNFYRRKCDKTGEMCVSVFSQEASVPVWSPKAWWADDWEATDYGQEYDFSKPFFEQFKELMHKVPQFSLQNQYTTLVNSDYTMMGTYNKNCYMVTNTAYCEDCDYTTFCIRGKSCKDVYKMDTCELCYESVNLRKCSCVIYSIDCEDCFDIAFSKNLRGCNNCFGCFNLRNKSYYIWNQPFTKEEYEQEIKKYNTGSYSEVMSLLNRFHQEDIKYPKRYMEGTQNDHVTGNYVYESKNAFNCFESSGLEDCKHCQFCFYQPVKDCYDMTLWGQNARFVYDCMGAGDNESMIKFSIDCWAQGSNIEYSYHIVVPNDDLFGCIGLKHKQYCILNKQYTKEEYTELLPKIKKHMDDMPYVDKGGKVYRYGEFFPSELSFFGYNETLAYSYLPLSKEQAREQGFLWKDMTINSHDITKKSSELPDDIKNVDESILNEIIEDEISGRAYRIVASELAFLRRMNLPLPRRHPNERHYNRVALRNSMKLWHRSCMNNGCQNEFETSYSPDRPEKVYCESCYQKAVV